MIDSILEQIHRNRDIAVIAHISPDGDTMGCSLALYFALSALGKNPVVVCEQKLPPAYRFMPGYDLPVHPDTIDHVFDYALAVDVADIRRLGAARTLFEKAKESGCIDHHVTNPGFAQVNFINTSAAATSELVYELIERLNVPVTRDIADCLFVALCTDTGRFSYSNTTEHTLKVASRLVHYGAQVERIVRYVYRTRTPQKVKLIGRALSGMKLLEDGRLSLMQLSLADFADCGASESDAEDIVDYAIEISGIQAAIFMRETENGVKVSLRSWQDVDVAAVAQQFSGGGHVQAAGCLLKMSFEEAEAKLVCAMSCALKAPGECDCP